MDEPKLKQQYHQSPWFTLQFILGTVDPMGFDKSIMTYIYHHNLHRIFFTTVKILCALPTYLFLSPNPWLFTVSIVLPLPEGHTVGIIQYATLPDWLFSLTNKHLRFLQVLSWRDSSFKLFSTE